MTQHDEQVERVAGKEAQMRDQITTRRIWIIGRTPSYAHHDRSTLAHMHQGRSLA